MNRFFVKTENIDIKNKRILIEGNDVRHITRVLRLAKGDLLEICDGEKHIYIGEIEEITKMEVFLSIKETHEITSELSKDIILYQSIPKSNKMDYIIQKTVEIGVKEIVPLITSRTIVQFKNHKDKEKKVKRWQKIAEEAAKQSKRGTIPTIHMPIAYTDALVQDGANNLNIIPYVKEREASLRQAIKLISGEKPEKIGIWVGPEGGFEATEIDIAREQNLIPISLGPRILRTETVGITMLSILAYELGDLGG